MPVKDEPLDSEQKAERSEVVDMGQRKSSESGDTKPMAPADGRLATIPRSTPISLAPLRPQPRGDIREPEHADYLAAIWIIASNDEQPIITYRGLSFRLNIPEQYARQLVASRPELFRLRVPERRLDQWKQKMRDGKHWPSWVLALEDTKRQAAIDAIGQEDCFRSQFRAEDSAPRSDLAVIDWGLKHLDRVRSAMVKYDEGIAKSWQIWLGIGLTVLNIIVHLVTASAKHP